MRCQRHQPGVQARIESLLTKITTIRPDARVFLAKGSPYSGYDSSVATINNILATVAANFQAAGKKITVVDLNTGYPAGQFVDTVHPNATGYNWMANRWFDAMTSVYATGQNSLALANSSSVTVQAAARLEGTGLIGGPLTVRGTYADNLLEFALGGNPLLPGDRGTSQRLVQKLAGQPAMTLTIADRAGAAFVSNSNQSISAGRDGIIYRIEGSQELTTWTGGVTELIPALTTGLPAAPGG